MKSVFPGGSERYDRWMHVVVLTLSDGIADGRRRGGEGCGDTGLHHPGQPITAAQTEVVAKLERKSHARSEVVPFEIASRARKSVPAEEIQRLRLKVEHGPAIVHNSRRKIQRIPHA